MTWPIRENDLAKNDFLKRGFKAEAERLSKKFRKDLGLKYYEPLCGFELAEYLNIDVISPENLGLDDDQLDILMGTIKKSSGWSALTMTDEKNRKVILHNSRSTKARHQSDLMHELAHIICKHIIKPPTGIVLPSYMRYYDKSQEAEAEYLGSALQLPRECLVWALKKGMTRHDIAENYTASLEMVRFRINSTGVTRQLKYMR